ncbi:MAG: hypothetical protein WBQ86_17235 [Candidatus Binatus sp.]
MIPKISLTAAFLLMVAPPMASASTRDAANRAPLACQAHESPLGIIVAQDAQPNLGTDSDSDNNDSDNDSNDNDNDNNNQMDQQNATGNDQPAAVPPQVFNAPDNDSNDAQQNQAPQPEPVNPYQ